MALTASSILLSNSQFTMSDILMIRPHFTLVSIAFRSSFKRLGPLIRTVVSSRCFFMTPRLIGLLSRKSTLCVCFVILVLAYRMRTAYHFFQRMRASYK